MTAPIIARIALPPLPTISPMPSETTNGNTGDFLETLQHALTAVSQNQSAASAAEEAVASGTPGASTASALVLSDRAELGFNAVVAVRNEVVAAYQTIMNMQI